MSAWIPANFEEACKRNAGRRKLHIRRRQARAGRILRLLGTIDPATSVKLSTYGKIAVTSRALAVSKPTASRDCGLVRRIHRQVVRMFGRNYEPKRDRVVWSWNWAHYGFTTRETEWARHKKPVGHFPFDTRKQETEESYCGFDQSSWRPNSLYEYELLGVDPNLRQVA
jgi:hypothetical protein